MIFTIRVNKDDNLVYRLCEWDPNEFLSVLTPKIKLQCEDYELRNVRQAFENISCLEIFEDEKLIGEFTQFDSFQSITYEKVVFVANQQVYTSCFSIVLTKKSLGEQIQELQKIITNKVDVNAMTVEEFKEYIINQIHEDCQKDIYQGMNIELSEGNSKYFTYTAEDQINILQLFLMSQMTPDIGVLPYHSSGCDCEFFTADEIKIIYYQLINRLISITTYCNQLIMYVRSLDDKVDLYRIKYGMTLPQAYANRVSDITSPIYNKMIEILHPGANEE